MARTIQFGAIFLGGLMLMVQSASAQAPPTQPLPPTGVDESVSPPPSPASVNPPIPNIAVGLPDTLPLSGVQSLRLANPSETHNFLLPSLSVGTQVQTNPYNSSVKNSTGLISTTYIAGNLALNHVTAHSELLMDYLAGASFSSDTNEGSSGIQGLNFSDSYSFGRWSLLAGDQLNYSSQSPFGFGGLGGLGGLGISAGSVGGTDPGFNPGLLPDQSVQIGGSPRVGNAVVGQGTYALTHRSSVTLVGTYGLLKFIGTNLQNSDSFAFQGGYNYALSGKDSVAVSYRYDKFRFSHSSQGFDEQGAQFSYSRQLTGRMSFQIGAGPEFESFQEPIAGSSTVVSWSLSSVLQYQRAGYAINASYQHGLSAGSGVLTGATSDVVQSAVQHSFSGSWDGAASVGYSRNRALVQTTVNAANVSPQGYFASLRVNRHFVRNGSVFFAYNIARQTGLQQVCTLAVCNADTLTHTISVGYTWGLRPVVLN